MKRFILIMAVAFAFILAPSGCDSIKVDQRDKANGKMAACYMADSLISQFKAGGAAAKAAAGIVKANTQRQDIKAAATALQRGENAATNRNILLNYVKKSC